jgi:hypothetical protein
MIISIQFPFLLNRQSKLFIYDWFIPNDASFFLVCQNMKHRMNLIDARSSESLDKKIYIHIVIITDFIDMDDLLFYFIFLKINYIY